MARCNAMKLALKSNTVTILILFICVFPLFFSQVVNGHGGSHDEDEEHVDEVGAHPDVRSKGLILVKIYCFIVLLVSTFVCGVSPYFLRWNETFLLLGTQFAGGIFLATSLLHFLSDSNETFEDLTENHYPFAYMLASFGYIFTMLCDCIILYVTQRSHSSGDAKIEVDVEEQERNRIAPSAHLQPAEVLFRSSSFSDTVLLIAALCFHSVFEGIAIGVADNKADAWRSLWTISLHKVFAAIAMGIALLRLLPDRPFLATIAYSFAFAISSPIGVGIGIGIDATTQGKVADWIYAISMGFATGIFIYVAIHHLISKGYKPEKPSFFDTPFFKFASVLLGVGVMAVVMIWD
ncbi:hypothetical protein C5167_007709 [Papaver somniferum]|uniref:zinc transporter 1-like n=1 Tax=Papaver somniferum TaxID=3469 RepID=UPI000E70037E|nr:zinc transporter 1-like [Papaver somniferum]RZC93668.1 hypothetical protein C5167_007709 [Papaver somniferum]